MATFLPVMTSSPSGRILWRWRKWSSETGQTTLAMLPGESILTALLLSSIRRSVIGMDDWSHFAILKAYHYWWHIPTHSWVSSRCPIKNSLNEKGALVKVDTDIPGSRLILQKGGNPDLQDINGCTVTHILVVYDNMKMFDMAVECGAAINITNKLNLTPLTMAAYLAKY